MLLISVGDKPGLHPSVGAGLMSEKDKERKRETEKESKERKVRARE